MDYQLIGRLIVDKLHDRTTYVLAAIVGTLINLFGQLLVPWFRAEANPFSSFGHEFEMRPGLTLFSVFLAYAFPLCVGIYSAVAARYKNRRMESIADFPERNPDPVFRATRSGELVELGATTRQMFERHGIDCAQRILGEEVWNRIAATPPAEGTAKIFFAAENAEYLVAHAPTRNEQINVYMTRLPD